MDITPVIRTFHNKKGKTIRILKNEIIVPITKKIEDKEVTEPFIVSKKVKTVVYDNALNPISCREVVWSKGKVIKEDVYQPEGGFVKLKQGHGKNTRVTLLQNLGFLELFEKFLK